jgi:CysZ protein
MTAPGPLPRPMGFGRGLALPFRGAKLVYVDHPDLIRYWMVPLLVTLLTLIGSVAAVLAWDDALVGWLWPDPGEGEGLEGWLLDAAHGAFGLVLIVLLLLVAAVVALLVGTLVAAPFNARLAEVIDERVTGTRPPPLGLGRLALDLLRVALLELAFAAVNVALFGVGLVVPGAGPVVFVLGLAAWAGYFALTYVDVPLAARGRGVTDRLRFTVGHPLPLLGFGTGVGLFLFVPFVNLLFMPAAVAGGVLLVAELEREAVAARPEPPLAP